MKSELYPTETECPVCRTLFQQPQRSQGGGKRTIYCSPKCRSLDWVRGNGGKRKATILKYESHPENKAKKYARERSYNLKKYGWSEEAFNIQLTRQGRACAGCLAPLDRETARIDHCHDTGVVRGLLCDLCNWGLGHLKDNAMTLRRLMAYIERDPRKTMVYLTGALKNPRIPEIGNELRGYGYDVMDEWFTPGEFADTNWQNYEKLRGRSYTEALRGRAASNVFMLDRAYLDLSDVVVLVMPAGKSAMLELGYAAGRGKRTFILLDGVDPERYDVMPALVDGVHNTTVSLIEALK